MLGAAEWIWKRNLVAADTEFEMAEKSEALRRHASHGRHETGVCAKIYEQG